jgi:integrase
MTMDDLTYTLKQLCWHNRDGSFATQADRLHTLTLAARQLREAGSRQMRATSLKGKHIDILLQRWQAEGLSAGTVKNRMAHLRWWAEKVGKAGVIVANNASLGIPDRRLIPALNKAKELDARLEHVTDAHVRLSLRLQAAFGLRREEAIKFQPAYADRGTFIALKGSWTKGGKPRTVPITTPEQRAVLDAAWALAGKGSLIPPDRTYIQQRNLYDGQCKATGLSNMHGLRHAYAQRRYEVLTGWKSPLAGGPSRVLLTPEQRLIDAQARQTISWELGHERIAITAVYCGR